MAYPKMVTQEAVRNAVAAILSRQGTITSRAIYDEIGGGSMTTIAAQLREYRKEMAQKQAPPAELVALPPALDEVMRHSAVEMWRAAQHECQVMVAAVKAQAQKEVVEAVAERDQHLSELEATTNELEEAKDKITASEATSQQQGRELSEERIARITAETRTAELDRQLQALQGDIKGERAKRDEADNGRRAAESALSAAQTQLARVAEQFAGLTLRLTELQDQKNRSLEALDKIQETNQRLEADAREGAAQLGRLQGELEALKAAAAGKGAAS
jgi:chromosome segregation ATPase